MAANQQDSSDTHHVYDVVVIGMGAAGVGVSVALTDAGIENIMGLERYTVGASFARWPAEMRFITPSFATNSVGMLDINPCDWRAACVWTSGRASHRDPIRIPLGCGR